MEYKQKGINMRVELDKKAWEFVKWCAEYNFYRSNDRNSDTQVADIVAERARKLLMRRVK